MTDVAPRQPAGSAAQRRPTLARNVLANWAWYVLVVASGFILPRLVDHYQGQSLLGVWDFGWSLVIYISFLSLGVASAVSPYVARAQTLRDWRGLNVTVNSALGLLLLAAVLGIALAVGLAALVPRLLPEASPGELHAARWLVLLLAAKTAVQLPAAVFNGVITGYERFDLLNRIRILRDGGVLALMIGLLYAGFGLVALGAALLVTELLAEAAKYLTARRLCRQMRLAPRFCQRAALRELLGFGGKAFVQSIARGGVYQASSLLVGIFLGPAALAVYARQRALIMHAERFVRQYAQVFIPRTSAVGAGGDPAGLRELLVTTSRYGFYITLPLLLVLLVLGGPVLEVWMGSAYRAPLVLGIMAIGHVFCIPQIGVYSALLGLGRHGLPAAFEIGAAVLSVGLGVLLLGPLGAGLTGAAAAMTGPIALSGGVVLPVYACRLLGLPLGEYARAAVIGPLILSVPGLVALIAARVLLDEAVHELVAGVGASGVVTGVLYWRWALPAHMRARISALRPGIRRARRVEGCVCAAEARGAGSPCACSVPARPGPTG